MGHYDRVLADRKFLDGILDSNFSFLLADKELEGNFWELIVDIDVSSECEWGWTKMRAGEEIFIVKVDINCFYFVLKRNNNCGFKGQYYNSSYESEDYNGMRFVSYNKADKRLHWNEILG